MAKIIHPGGSSTLPVQTSTRTCPKCGSSCLNRVQRRVIDRVIGLAVALKRYQCGSCSWEGNLKFKRD